MTLDRIQQLKVTLEYDGVYATPAFTGPNQARRMALRSKPV